MSWEKLIIITNKKQFMTIIATKYPFVGNVDTKQGGRDENQDNAGFVDTSLGLLLVVCDGMGGGAGGKTASHLAVDTILTVLSDVSEHSPRKEALEFAIGKANDIIYTRSKERQELRGMGTTAAVVLINEDSAVIAHIGDTRFYQLRKGAIIFRSSDHSFVANLVRQKKLTEEEARNHPQSNIVTRALGIRPTVEIEFDEVTFQRGDRFVICTDGIWGSMPQRDLVKSLSRTIGINELTVLITEEIDKIGQEAGGGHDNMTLVIFDTPFDSVLKKIKKKPLEEINVTTKKTIVPSNHFKSILFALIVIAVFIICFFVYLSAGNHDKLICENEIMQRGATVTTVGNSSCELGEYGAPSQGTSYGKTVDKNDNGNNIFSNLEKDFKDAEFKLQLDRIITNLDSLKRIRGNNKDRAEKTKRDFINKV